jgi:hypothetical protein
MKASSYQISKYQTRMAGINFADDEHLSGETILLRLVIVGVSFINLSIIFGIWYSFSVFFVDISREFGWSHAATAGFFRALCSWPPV